MSIRSENVFELWLPQVWHPVFSAELRLDIRHDFQTRLLKRAQAVRVEDEVLLKLLWHQRLETRELDLVIDLALQLLPVARHVGLPSLDARFEFQAKGTVLEE